MKEQDKIVFSSYEKEILIVITKTDSKKKFTIVLHGMTMEADLIFIFRESTYDDHNIFMVTWWRRYS